jgi:hypothetical protein
VNEKRSVGGGGVLVLFTVLLFLGKNSRRRLADYIAGVVCPLKREKCAGSEKLPMENEGRKSNSSTMGGPGKRLRLSKLIAKLVR